MHVLIFMHRYSCAVVVFEHSEDFDTKNLISDAVVLLPPVTEVVLLSLFLCLCVNSKSCASVYVGCEEMFNF